MSVHTFSAEANMFNRTNIVMDASPAAVAAAEARAKAEILAYRGSTAAGRITRNGEAANHPPGHVYHKGNR